MRMYLFSLMLLNGRMKTIDEIHRVNLAVACAEAGGVSKLAEKIGREPSQVSQWLNGSVNSGTGKARGMGLASCRRVEVALGKRTGWMDVEHPVGGVFAGAKAFDKNATPAAMGKRAIPVISAIQAGAMKEITAPYELGDGYATVYIDDGYSRWAFALEIEGDSMLPEFRAGDLVIIEPDWEPRPGECVAAKNGKEEATFKKYRQRGVDKDGNVIFELVPLNEDYQTLRSDETPLVIIGVMAEHRRKTRR